VTISGMEVDPLRFSTMPILACLTLVEGAIHDITLTNTGRTEAKPVALGQSLISSAAGVPTAVTTVIMIFNSAQCD
jgi:hypothetical protein